MKEFLSVSDAYDEIYRLLNEYNKYLIEDEFIEEFNQTSLALEDLREYEELPAQEETLAWEIIRLYNKLLVVSPPMIYKNKGVRLGVPINDVSYKTHLNVYSFPFPQDDVETFFKPCITTNQNNVISVFSTWDYVSRVGINKAKNQGIITQGWINNVFDNMPKCKKELYDLIGRYKKGTKSNREIEDLERLCCVYGITSRMIHGEGSRDKQGRYYNSWFDSNLCTCCNRTYREPSIRYPNSFLAHVKTLKHRKNAVSFLLKQRIDDYTNK